MESINERIMQLVKELGFNKNSFSKEIKLSGSAVLENIVAGRLSKPSYEVINKILLAFDNVDAKWLITGKGSMFKPEEIKEINNVDLANEEEEKYYNCDNCKKKQLIINNQEQRIRDLMDMIKSKDKIIELLESK